MSEPKVENKPNEHILKYILNNALKDIMSGVYAECGSLFLFDSAQNELILNAFYNSENLAILGIKKKMGEGITGKVVGTHTPILVKNINEDSRFRQNGFGHYRTGSFMSIPLFSGDRLLGLINVADKSSGEPFSEKDLEFAVALSRYCVMTINHLHSFNEQRSALEKYASVGKLAAGIVHEVNNPLDGIIRYTNILLEQAENNSVVQEYLLEIKKGLGRIANTTQSLLEFSKQFNSNAVRSGKYVDVHQVIDDTLSVLAHRKASGVQVIKKYKEGLPKVRDAGLSNVVMNIVKNAFDAIAEKGRLEIVTDVNDGGMSLAFHDTGAGIDLKIKERIFEPFFTTKSIDRGSGLGLAISREIMHRYGGEIEVESAPGKGSIFRVIIPKKHLENAEQFLNN